MNGLIENNKSIQRIVLTKSSAEKIKKCLFHSWNSEVLLRSFAGFGDEFLTVCMQWMPTMFYYRFYHALNAYLAASGQDVHDHGRAIACASHAIKRFPKILGANCTKLNPPQYGMEVSAQEVDAIQNLATPNEETYSLVIARALKKTREWKIDKKLSAVAGRKTAARKRHADEKLPPTTLCDYFHRMRERFNYGDSEIVLQGDFPALNPSEMHRAMMRVYGTYTTGYEWLISRYVGPEITRKLFEEYRERHRAKLAGMTMSRIEVRIKKFEER